MKTHLFTFFFLCCIAANAQDTLEIIALTYDSTTRAVMVDFPEEGEFRKVEMVYSMRCHNLAVGNGAVGCREWDYSCNTVLTVPERTDSLRRVHPDYTISSFTGETFDYSETPTSSYNQYTQQKTAFNSSPFANTSFIGTGDTSVVLSDGLNPTKTFLVYSAEELLASGAEAGMVRGIDLEVVNPTDLTFLRLRLGHSAEAVLNANKPPLDGLQEVYFSDISLDSGKNALAFYEAFEWDGTSNLLIEMTYQAGSGALELVTDQVSEAVLTTDKVDRQVQFTGIESFDLDIENLSQINEQVTFSFWAYGDQTLPQNTFAFEGFDVDGNRQAGVHLPWSDSNIYWDCGNDGSGYDRLSKQAFVTDYRNVWTHWTFTKDANTGVMKIMKNGLNFANGVNTYKHVNLDDIIFGANKNGGTGYLGYMDDFRIWSAVLDQVTVQDYMFKDIDAEHPFYEELIAEYRLDEVSGATISSSSPNSATGTSDDVITYIQKRGKDLRKNFVDPMHRPVLGVIQGNPGITINEQTVLESYENTPHQVIQYGLDGSDLIVLDTLFLYPGGTQNIYDENGDVVGSIEENQDGTITVNELTYYLKSDARYEITSFVTPYGNGLDLGPDGKTFYMDLTDFLPIMKGQRLLTVEGVGNYQEEMDIRFRFITGTPARDVLDIQQLWPIRGSANIWSGYGFGNILEDDVFEPRTINLNPDAGSYKLRSAITGHGSNGEFTSQAHYMDIDGDFQEFQYNVWKECAYNPMYPQGGTWIFDRAGWCPGMETDIHEFELTDWIEVGQTIDLDYGINGINPGAADYRISNQLVTYGPRNFAIDVEISDIMRPSSKFAYDRFNPSCSQPLISVINNGSESVSKIYFEYGLVNGDRYEYEWTGFLSENQTAEIELPVYSNSMWEGNQEGKFEVQITSVNGALDEYPENDKMTSDFKTVLEFERNFRLEFKSDNNPGDNSYRIFDSSGEQVFTRSGFVSNTVYSDILNLPGGCYTFDFSDFGDDGLEFWFFAGNGIGNLRFDEMNDDDSFGNIAYQFDPDFGGGVQLDFMVRGTTDVEENAFASLVNISPNPAYDVIEVHWQSPSVENASVTLYNALGQQVVQSQHIESYETLRLNVSNLQAGQYFVSIQNEHGTHSEIVEIFR